MLPLGGASMSGGQKSLQGRQKKWSSVKITSYHGYKEITADMTAKPNEDHLVLAFQVATLATSSFTGWSLAQTT